MTNPIKNNRNYKHYIIPIVLSILILSVLGVYAGLTLSNSNANYLQGSNNGNYTTMNESGVYFNNNKAFSRTADVVVCRGTSVLDDLIKSFTCDVVCKSSDNDCGNDMNNNCQGTHCLLRKGIYPCTTTINLTSNSFLEGEGMYITLINSTSTSQPVIRNNDLNGNENIVIQNLGIDGNYQIKTDYNYDYGIRFDGVNNFIIDNVYFTKTYSDAINIQEGNLNDTNNGKITNCDFFNISREGVQFEYGSDMLVADNHFNWINSRAINFENFVNNGTESNNIIRNNIIKNVGSGGMVFMNTNGLKGLYNFIISGNTIQNSIKPFGIYKFNVTGIMIKRVGNIVNISNILIIDNIISNLSNESQVWSDGIMVRLNKDNNLKVSGNLIDKVSRYGIYASHDGAMITNNMIENVSTCIQVDTANNFFSGNILNDCRIGIALYNAYNTSILNNRLTLGATGISFANNGWNSIISNNFIKGFSSFGIYTDATNISIYNNNLVFNTNKYSGTKKWSYIDDLLYSGNLTQYPCYNSNNFDGKTIHNSSTQCTCVPTGHWNCVVLEQYS